MQKYGYKALLLLLRGLMGVKRAAVWLLSRMWQMLVRVDEAYRNTIGFRIYKILFTFKRGLWHSLPTRAGGAAEWFGRRGTLQGVLFVIALILMIPHSRLYGRDAYAIPGRGTLLYTLVGPGEDDAPIEEITADIAATPLQSNPPAWRQGAVSVPGGAIPSQTAPVEPQEIAGISAGGSALTKPIILPGNTVPTAHPSERRDIVLYRVQPGDVVGAIARRFGVSIQTILSANNLTARSYIRPGDILKILPVDGLIHTVRRADTVAKIARLYKAEEKDIIAWNKLQSDGSDIVIGEQLIIPGGRMPFQSAPAVQPRRYTVLNQIAAPPPSVAAPAGTGYLWPTAVRRITQYFTWRHTGVDIAGPLGTALYAARSGTVIQSQGGWNGGYGRYIIIDHGDGVHTLYGHASQLFVNVGEFVEQGQTIAIMGSTGHSTGPHVHFEVRVNGRRLNPLRYIR